VQPVIDALPPADIDRLEPLWRQLLAHHVAQAPHLSRLGAVRSATDSWRVRRAQYLQWLGDPSTRAFVSRDQERLLGYAVVRVIASAGSWQWGERIGMLETLVVDDDVRGAGVGQALLDEARTYLSGQGVEVISVSVVAGNEGALRFYRRAGAVEFVHTLLMPAAR
jgi:ribosomal protein S18 acetylase RimI-like enzyme